MSLREWRPERDATGTNGLSVSQIRLLTDANDKSVCSTLNKMDPYDDFLNDKNSIGEPSYNLSYYKTGSFYFVVVTNRQPSRDDLIIVGLSFLHVYDKNLNLKGAYAF